MTFEKKIAAFFALDEEGWQRHSNPWSVITRFTVLPLLVLAAWSHAWFGWWALLPVGIVLFWMWINPNLFPKPKSIENWASKSVYGERIWLNRDQVPIPDIHRMLPNTLNVVALAGLIFIIWGIIRTDFLLTMLGLIIVVFAKTWFLDRMVWLYEDMKDKSHLGDVKPNN